MGFRARVFLIASLLIPSHPLCSLGLPRVVAQEKVSISFGDQAIVARPIEFYWREHSSGTPFLATLAEHEGIVHWEMREIVAAKNAQRQQFFKWDWGIRRLVDFQTNVWGIDRESEADFLEAMSRVWGNPPESAIWDPQTFALWRTGRFLLGAMPYYSSQQHLNSSPDQRFLNYFWAASKDPRVNYQPHIRILYGDRIKNQVIAYEKYYQELLKPAHSK